MKPRSAVCDSKGYLSGIAFQALAINPPPLLELMDSAYEAEDGIAVVRVRAGGMAWNYAASTAAAGGIRPILKRAADFFDPFGEQFSIVVSRDQRLLIRSLRRSGWYMCDAESAWVLAGIQRIASYLSLAPSWRIRALDRSGDLPLWIEVLESNFASDARFLRDDIRPDRALFSGKDVQLFLAEEQGRAIGGCAVRASGEVAVVSALSVTERHRGHGLGSALARTAIQAARQAGCSAVALIATPTAFAFYQRLGFQPAGSLYRYAPPLRGLKDWAAIHSGEAHSGR